MFWILYIQVKLYRQYLNPIQKGLVFQNIWNDH